MCHKWMEKGQSAFRFPVDDFETMIKWRKASNFSADYKIKDSDCICINHFRPEDISAGSKTRKRLIIGSAPKLPVRPVPRIISRRPICTSKDNPEEIEKFLSKVQNQNTSIKRINVENMGGRSLSEEQNFDFEDVKCFVCLRNFASKSDLSHISPFSDRTLHKVLG